MYRSRSQFTACGLILLSSFSCGSGCGPTSNNSIRQNDDPYSEAISELEDQREKPFILASKPILEAIAKRDYDTLYQLTSSHALKQVNPQQFGPVLDAKGELKTLPAIANMTKEQFLEMMGEMEKRLARPMQVSYLTVQTIDPNELAGKADKIDNMFNIGGMPAEIPFEIRKASIRAQIRCELPPEGVKKIAQDLNIPEDKVRYGQLPENDVYDEEDWPYFNLKFVLVEDGGQLKVGYFEFMPPSILD